MSDEENENNAPPRHGPQAGQMQAQFAPIPSLIPFPAKLDMDGNLSSNWKKFRRMWDNYEIAAGLTTRENALRTATFLTCIGSEANDIYDGFDFLDQDADDLATVIAKFEAYCMGKINITYERYVFNCCKQEDESFDSYLSKLRKLSKTCQYQHLQDELIKDRIVVGVKDNSVRKRLLQEENLTLRKCVDICRSAESTTAKLKTIVGASVEDVHAVGKSKLAGKHRNTPNSSHKHTTYRKCKYCGQMCEKGKCPAFGKKCSNCLRYNHFSSECRSARRSSQYRGKRHNVRQIEYLSGTEDDDDFEIMMINKKHEVESKIFANMVLTEVNQTIKFQLDSGATTNLIPEKYVPKDKIQNCERTLRMYNNAKLQPVGSCKMTVKNQKTNKRYSVPFTVVSDEFPPLLGAMAIQKMNLVRVQYHNICAVSEKTTCQDIVAEYDDVFRGEGCFQKELHLETDPSVTPVKNAARRVPIAMKSKLKQELDKLEKAKIIKKVETPTDWVSNVIVVKKSNGKLRICIDPKPLNMALQRSHCSLPVLEDLLPELSRAKVFSRCDIKNAFWHIQLDESSSFLTTFESPFSRYRWLKMPFGISPAPEYFQQYLDRELEGLKGVKAIADDILVYGDGDTLEEAQQNHDNSLRNLLQRCRERNIKLNKDKLQLSKHEMPYIGHLLTKDGVKPDPAKVEAIMQMPKPTDVKGVQRLLGTVNYLTKFLSNLSNLCEPIRRLTHKDSAWEWTFEQDKALQKIKEAVCNTPVLRFFNSKEKTTLQCDSSESGLGAVLMQEGQPVGYASRALTDTEKSYAQIEKELLAVVFGVEHFHQFTYGRKVYVESDHKPLETIYMKPLHKAPKRLQRMLLRLQHYDLQLQYKKGSEMYLSDTLSRAYLDKTENARFEDILHADFTKEIESIRMSDYLAVSESKKQQLRKATIEDDLLPKIIVAIQNGWNTEPPLATKPYYNIRDELSVEDNIVYRGERCVIPNSMRRDILKQLHSHIGIQGCLRRARELVYWPNMTAMIKDYIGNCETCRSFESKQTKEPIIQHTIPDRPWAKVGTDVMTFENKDYLVTVDYQSNFFEIDRLNFLTSKEIIAKLKHHFARHGIPDTLVSDQASVFKSEEFEAFRLSWDFEHIFSSARHPQSNGKAENAVKTAKRILKKAKHAGTDPMLALLHWRNTPMESTNISPVQLLFSRQTKTLLPVRSFRLKPQTLNSAKTEQRLNENKRKQKFYYNRGTKPLSDLSDREVVRVMPENRQKTWQKGLIIGKPQTRSYNILKESGTIINRNRRAIRKTTEPFTPQPPPIMDTPQLEISSKAQSPIKNSLSETQEPIQAPAISKPITTRCGRKIVTPAKFKDFVKT